MRLNMTIATTPGIDMVCDDTGKLKSVVVESTTFRLSLED
jgi:hypothetical protein